MFTLAVSNYKGGVGKTTTAVNLAHVYAAQGKRVLLIDLDPQASATDFFRLYDEAEETGRSSIGLLYENRPIDEVAFRSDIPNIDVVPSVIDLIDQNEVTLHEQALKFALDDVRDCYDIAIIDCSPVMKRLAFAAYIAASKSGMVIIPVKLDSSVMRGTALTVNAMQSVASATRMPLPRWKILRTCVPGFGTRSEATGASILDCYFSGEQFESMIHASTKVCEGSWVWQPVVTFEPKSRPANDYMRLAREVLHELEK